jgi:hypothetical protein
MNTAEVTRARLPQFIEMLSRYGAVKIVITDDPKHDVWVVEWENGEIK